MKVSDSDTIMGSEQMHSSNVRKRESEVWADDTRNVHSEKRAHKRIPSDLQARLLYGNLIYTGKITNLSEGGMFVSTRVNFPVNSVVLLVMLVNDCVMKVPIKVKRTVKTHNNSSENIDPGLGVELVKAPKNYLDYVSSCKAAA